MLRLHSAILDTLCNPACLPSNPTCHRIPERSRRARTQKKQPQDASTSSAILDGLSNPGRLSKAAIYFVMERATRKPASVPHLPVSSSLAEPSTTTFFISSMRCNRLHCMLRHFFGCDKYHFGNRYASSFWDRWLLWLWLFFWSGRIC